MKTITEDQPLIFSRLAERAGWRRETRRQLAKNAGMITAYSVAGIALMVDTGCLPWTPLFWAMFAPLFVAGELAAHALRSK